MFNEVGGIEVVVLIKWVNLDYFLIFKLDYKFFEVIDYFE